MNAKHFFKMNAVAIAALLFAGATLSFKTIEKANEPDTYYYTSTDMYEGAFHQVGNWETTNNPNDPCSLTQDRPCKIFVSENETLSDILGNKSNKEVLLISDGYKAAP